MATGIGVDPQTMELAEHFLDGVTDDSGTEISPGEKSRMTQDLAETIQRAVESWFTEQE